MASTLYRSIFEKGRAEGRAQGRAKRCADTIVQILVRRAGTLDAAVAERIRAVSNPDVLDVWLNEALDIPDAAGAQRLIKKIRKATATAA